MTSKYVLLSAAGLLAFAFATPAQAYDDQADITRQLNLAQLSGEDGYGPSYMQGDDEDQGDVEGYGPSMTNEQDYDATDDEDGSYDISPDSSDAYDDDDDDSDED